MTETNHAPAAATERRTALHARHAALGASFTDFGGWQMPLKYGSELAEHRAVRTGAGIFDLSHMGEIWLEGPGSGAALDYALIGKLSAVAVGRAKYSLIVSPEGGILDDLIVYRLGEERFLVVPNAGNAELVSALLRERAAGFDTVLTDATAETSLLAVQGPRAEALLARLAPEAERAELGALRYYAAAEFTLDGRRHLVARTGYTGEDGFEIFVPNADAEALWDALLEAADEDELIPCGLAARDSLRLEAGMPLYGNELGPDVLPHNVGLGRAVAYGKEGDFVGRAALEAARDAGLGVSTGVRLVALRGLGRRAGRAGYPVYAGDRAVGTVTSGQPSPSLGYPIAFALVEVGSAEPGTALEVDLRGKREAVEVVETPFYRREPAGS